MPADGTALSDEVTRTGANDPRRRRPPGSGFDRLAGRRVMREYPLTEGELNELAALGIGATCCLSVAGAMVGFALDVAKDVALADTAPATVRSFWNGVEIAGWVGGAVFALAGLLLILRGRSRLRKIKSETDHGD